MGLLKDKVILITGGASGIGKAVSFKVAMEDGNTIVTDINDSDGKNIVKEIKERGKNATYLHLDVTSEKEVKNVFEYIKNNFGGVDGLVNNAGVSGLHPYTHEAPTEEWDKVLSVNLRGVFLCSKYAIKQMIDKDGGSIVNMSSIAAKIGSNIFSPAYHATKGGVLTLTLHDAITYAPYKIRVNAIQPGFVDTPMVRNVMKAFGDEDVLETALNEIIPWKRMANPDEVAELVIFLLSDKSKYITGSGIVIDGALTAGIPAPEYLMESIKENLKKHYTELKENR